MDTMFWTGLGVTCLNSVITVVLFQRGANITRGFRRGSAAVSIFGLMLASIGSLGGESPWISKVLVVGLAALLVVALLVLGFVLTPRLPPAPRQDP